jgi:hypothetical protein
MRRRAVIAMILAALAIAGACHTDPASPAGAPAAPTPVASQPVASQPVASQPVASQPVPAGVQPCGSRTCAAGELCEDLYKGHRVDAEGRPLDHVQCVPLPDACRSTPTCACVRKYLAATHCDDGVPVRIDDYPR